ncbi:carotenoid biosynthesis protein [Mucilaginibacter aquatilis]|uniref:Carotenoid biosynthesis protein n=1 Tax=Mucilaginibacter aquatilis TaxID=1517760 RepID=A0A6I4IQ92_9SPHI|nr:carotenoid biosynthesis protein [Mucilaginibacter aquatilis]MVN90714.1 carotenoid biosynthesis protein [Mucilaginibacter aquatilis]
MKMSKSSASVAVIILFHAVGLLGFFITPFRSMFLRLVPFHLLLMLAVVIINHENWREGKFWAFAALIFTGGFTAEWIGVHTNIIFGDYDYGHTLGTKVFDIPLMIGVNWFLLVYATGVLLKYLKIPTVALRMLVGAIVLVCLDLLIEPVAIKFDYWSWVDLNPPLKNYLGWFGVSALFLGIFELFKFKHQNITAPALLVVQFIFFALLQLA